MGVQNLNCLLQFETLLNGSTELAFFITLTVRDFTDWEY